MSSTDLQLLQDLPKLSVPTPPTNINVSVGQDDDVVTPTSKEHKIPPVLSCPPAPRKPRRKVSCKRKLLELEFFEIVNRDEVDSFFASSFEALLSKRRCPCK